MLSSPIYEYAATKNNIMTHQKSLLSIYRNLNVPNRCWNNKTHTQVVMLHTTQIFKKLTTVFSVQAEMRCTKCEVFDATSRATTFGVLFSSRFVSTVSFDLDDSVSI